jgi:ubiquinone/menaquinone biosynthesis C-methylase UbiE
LTDFLRSVYAGETLQMLDCGVMSGVTLFTLRGADIRVDYTGIDISDAIISDCGANYPGETWLSMSAMDLNFPAHSFDVVNCRHLLEHLPYYETAVREMFRVSRRYVVICLFQVPKSPEKLLRRETPDGYIWLNRYAPGPFETLLDSLSEHVEKVDVAEGRRTHRVYLCTRPAT